MSKRLADFSIKSICKFRWSYPVINVQTGEAKTCCKTQSIQLTEEMFDQLGSDAFLNNPYQVQRRREHLAGLKPESCSSCFELEKRGIQSIRQGPIAFQKHMNREENLEGNFYDFVYQEDKERLVQSHAPEILEINLSNLCDLKCVYCGPDFSTSWEREMIKFGEIHSHTYQQSKKVAPPSFEKYFWEWFERSNKSIKNIVFVGGEPLINPNFLPMVKRMVEILDANGPREKTVNPLRFQVISNFANRSAVSQAFFNYLPELAEKYLVVLEVSCENKGKRAEYVRSGLNWEDFSANLNHVMNLKLKNFRLGLQMAVGALALSDMKNYLGWVFELQQQYQCFLDYKTNPVVNPEYLSSYYLPKNFLDHIDETQKVLERTFLNKDYSLKDSVSGNLTHRRWRNFPYFLNTLKRGIQKGENRPDLYQDFFNFTERMRLRRGKEFLDFFPEYQEFYNSCQRLSEKSIGPEVGL